MTKQWTLAAHACRFEEPDLFFAKITAEKEIDVESLREFYALVAEVSQGLDFFYLMMDLGTSVFPSKEGRAAMPGLVQTLKPFAMLIYAGTTTRRAMTMMMLRGQALAKNHSAQSIVVKTEEDAREWVNHHRATRASVAKDDP